MGDNSNVQQAVQPQLSALQFDEYLPFICSKLQQTTKSMCIFDPGSVLILFYISSPERSIIFSKAFQFDIFNIPLLVQVSHDQSCYLKKRHAEAPDCVPAALIVFVQTWFRPSIHSTVCKSGNNLLFCEVSELSTRLKDL